MAYCLCRWSIATFLHMIENWKEISRNSFKIEFSSCSTWEERNLLGVHEWTSSGRKKEAISATSEIKKAVQEKEAERCLERLEISIHNGHQITLTQISDRHNEVWWGFCYLSKSSRQQIKIELIRWLTRCSLFKVQRNVVNFYWKGWKKFEQDRRRHEGELDKQFSAWVIRVLIFSPRRYQRMLTD